MPPVGNARCPEGAQPVHGEALRLPLGRGQYEQQRTGGAGPRRWNPVHASPAFMVPIPAMRRELTARSKFGGKFRPHAGMAVR